MRRFILLSILILLAQPAHAGSSDMTRIGDYTELTRAIATDNIDLVLKHPAVEAKLRELTGPYYPRIANLALPVPIGYAPPFNLVVVGYSAGADYTKAETTETVMIVVDWTSALVHAALRTPQETLVFGIGWRLAEYPQPLRHFIYRDEILKLTIPDAGNGPAQTWISIYDYGDDRQQLWPLSSWQKPDKP